MSAGLMWRNLKAALDVTGENYVQHRNAEVLFLHKGALQGDYSSKYIVSLGNLILYQTSCEQGLI